MAYKGDKGGKKVSETLGSDMAAADRSNKAITLKQGLEASPKCSSSAGMLKFIVYLHQS